MKNTRKPMKWQVKMGDMHKHINSIRDEIVEGSLHGAYSLGAVLKDPQDMSQSVAALWRIIKDLQGEIFEMNRDLKLVQRNAALADAAISELDGIVKTLSSSNDPDVIDRAVNRARQALADYHAFVPR